MIVSTMYRSCSPRRRSCRPRAASQATSWKQIPIPHSTAFHPPQPKRIECPTHGDLPPGGDPNAADLAAPPAFAADRAMNRRQGGIGRYLCEVWRTGDRRKPEISSTTFSKYAPRKWKRRRSMTQPPSAYAEGAISRCLQSSSICCSNRNSAPTNSIWRRSRP